MVGLSLRTEDGRQGAPWSGVGAHRGLIIPADLAERSDLAITVEGASDVAACVTLGIASAGRPSNKGGVQELARLFRGKDLLVVGENDSKENGKWPGRDGAVFVARGLAAEWGAPVAWTMPPGQVKDVRAWLSARVAAGLDLRDKAACHAAGQELLAELRKAARTEVNRGVESLPSPAGPDGPGHPYVETAHGIVLEKATRDGTERVLLANFTARIMADVTRDDGAECRRAFTIVGRVGGAETLTFDVPAERFTSMHWPMEHMGVGAILTPGLGTKDHARAAIQHFSRGGVIQRTVYEHLGWRRIGDASVFLHAGGAIGSRGVVEAIEVDPPKDLGGYTLPPPPEGQALREAVQASLRLVEFAPHVLTIPLLAGIYRAILGPCPFALFIVGPSGSRKSSAAAVFLCHFGVGFDDKNLPASWSSTDNALEALAFATKDVPLVIDDFAPNGTAHDVARLHAKAERILRGAANQQGRGRLRADTRFRPTKHPRGLVICTGEDVPGGLSLRARNLIVEVAPDDIDLPRLSQAQRLAAGGQLTLAMSGFIRWLAPRLDSYRDAAKARLVYLRDLAHNSKLHARTPGIVADLFLGIEMLCKFAVDVGALDADGASEFTKMAWQALGAAAARQAAQQSDADPVTRFLRFLASAIGSGAAHVARAVPTVKDVKDEVPEDPAAWGWRLHVIGTGTTQREEWRPGGTRVGWIEGENLYLDMEAAHLAADRAAGDFPLGITSRTLSKRLSERGMLLGRESGDHISVKVTLHDSRRRVLHVRATILNGPGQPGHSDQDAPAEPSDGADAPDLCPGFGPTTGIAGAPDWGTDAPAAGEGGSSGAPAPPAPVAPVVESKGPGSVNGVHRPAPREACRFCGHRRWCMLGDSGTWQCGACHPPVQRDVVWSPDNEEGGAA